MTTARQIPHVLLLLALLLVPGLCEGGTYTVSFNGTSESSASALTREQIYTISDVWKVFNASLHAQAAPGVVYASSEINLTALSYFSTAGGAGVLASASTPGFLITGPPGATAVTATFLFTLGGAATTQGGYGGNDGQGGFIQYWLSAYNIIWRGAWWVGNGSTGGGYGLAGFDGPNQVVGLTGEFPVGTPFGVWIQAEGQPAVYGNDACSPMIVTTRASSSPVGAPQASVGNPAGLVMTLPAGYTVNSTEWNVVDNHFLSPVLAAPQPAPLLAPGCLAVRSANPSSGPVQLAFTLARAGDASLTVVDVAGRMVRSLAGGWHEIGEYAAGWDGTWADGRAAAPGVYFAVLRAEGRTSAQRLVRVR